MRLPRRQSGNARRAASTAASASAAVLAGNSPTTSAEWPGLWLGKRGPRGACHCPAMKLRPERTVDVLMVRSSLLSLRELYREEARHHNGKARADGPAGG